MADATVTQRFVGDSSSAERAIAAMEKKYDAALSKMQSANKKFKSGADQAAESIQKWALGLGGATAGLFSISNIFNTIIKQQEELIRKADEFGSKQDRRTRSFAVNAGITHKQAVEAEASMRAVAARTGVPLEAVEPAASGLVGAEFDWKEAAGASLEKLVEMRNVTGGGDIGELSGQVSLVLAGQGLEKNAANLERIGSDIWAARKAGRVEASSMQFLARQLALSKDQSFEENLALFTNLMDVAPDEVAGTAFGKLHKVLRAPTKKQRGAMAAAGIDPTKVDFHGENTQQVLDYISGKFKALPETGVGGQDDLLKQLIGEEFIAPAKHVFMDPGRFKNLMAAQANKAGYRAAVNEAQSGSAALDEKVKGIGEAVIAKRKDDLTAVMDLAESDMRASGVGELSIWSSRFMANRTRELGGTDPLGMLLPHEDDRLDLLTRARQLKGEPLQIPGMSQEWLDAIEANTKVVEENNRVLQQKQEPPKRAKVANANEAN